MVPAAPSAAPGSDQSGGAGSPADIQNLSYNPALGYLNAEERRVLNSPTFGIAPASVDIPRDTCIKRMGLSMVASCQVTYASGSPLLSNQGIFDRLCAAVQVNANGGRTIKNVRPHLARLMNIITSGSMPRRAYQTGASALTSTRNLFEWLAGSPAYPATTQWFQFAEMIELDFENVLGYGGSRSQTEFDTRFLSSAQLTMFWQTFSNLQKDGVGATVTYGTQSCVVTPQIIENKSRPRPAPGDVLYDYVENDFSRQYTGQSSSQQIPLITGNYIVGLGIYVNNGDTNQTPSDAILTNIQLQVNGGNTIQGPISQAFMQDQNKNRYGIDEVMGLQDWVTPNVAVGIHPLQGFAFMSMIKNGDWNTCLNTSKGAGVDSANLVFNTASTTGTDPATYTNPVTVTVHQIEIRPFVYTG